MSSTAIFLTIFGFFLGAVMFAYGIGKWALKRDIRELGDGNPGVYNLFKTGNIPLGVVAAGLEISKGLIPIGLALYVFNLNGWELVPIAFAPALGHAFSPFMGFKGGKAVAPLGGMWIALQPSWSLTFGLLIFIIPYLMMNTSGWALITTLSIMLLLQLIFNPDAILLTLWGLSILLSVYKFRADLRQAPALKRRNGRA